MILALFLLALALAFLAYALLRRPRKEPEGWSAGPMDYSAGTVVEPDGSFAFPTAPPGVHYVTRACGPLSKGITLRYRIVADAGVKFCPIKSPDAPSIGPVLYFQRRGDDWSGTGSKETYRWWASFAAPIPITPGEHEIVASFDGNWTAVETSSAMSNPQAFRDALKNAGRVGFTFGGGDGLGHGVYATGQARFELIALTSVG